MALRRGLASLKYLPKFQHFQLTVRLASDTSDVAWAESHGNGLQKARALELQYLVGLVRDRILESDASDAALDLDLDLE